MRHLKMFLPTFILVMLVACSNIDEQKVENFSSETHSKDQAKIYNEQSEKVASQPNRLEAKLLYVVDGDTIKVEINGREESVRFLLVDTPETNHPRLGKQPFGEEAKSFVKKLLNGDSVFLEKDVSERDKYGRLLMYVYTENGISVQEQLLKNGLARVAYVFVPNIKYVDQYREIERKAAKEGIGIWSVDGYAHLGSENGYNVEVFDGKKFNEKKELLNTPDVNGNCNGAIKGNQGSNGWIYHVPEGRYYSITKAEECFKTEDAAKKAGYRKSSS